MKLEFLVAPIVVFLLVVCVVTAGRFYDHLPVRPPPCAFKETTGIPCIACRATRSIRALADGHFMRAVKYHPLAVLGCVFTVFWLGGYILRKGRPPKRRLSTKTIGIIVGGLILLNWIYLILTEP